MKKIISIFLALAMIMSIVMLFSSCGEDGKTPYIGENGNWWIGDKDTGVKARGDDGKDGSDGSDGADGQVLDGGCGAVLGGSAAVIFAVAAAGALLVTKKRR